MIQCPINPDFKFHKKCTVKCCMFYGTNATANCIALSRKENNDGSSITDEEIMWFKNIPAGKWAGKKLRVKDRLDRLVALRKYVDHLTETGEDKKVEGQWVDEFLGRWPFSVPELGVRTTHVSGLFNLHKWLRFRNSGYASWKNIRLRQMLFLTADAFKYYRSQLRGKPK